MSHWKLVEAEPEAAIVEATNNTGAAQSSQGGYQYNNNNGGRGRGGGRGGGRGRGEGRGQGRSNYTGPYRSKSDRSYFAYLAVQQIDSIFNPDSLCMDTFVRSYMDEAGYVPVMLTMSYQNVAAFGCSYYDVVNKLKETVGKTKFLEFDAENELVRAREGWEKFLMPNPYGGKGLPRYRKQAPAPGSEQASYYGPQGAAPEPTTA